MIKEISMNKNINLNKFIIDITQNIPSNIEVNIL